MIQNERALLPHSPEVRAFGQTATGRAPLPAQDGGQVCIPCHAHHGMEPGCTKQSAGPRFRLDERVNMKKDRQNGDCTVRAGAAPTTGPAPERVWQGGKDSTPRQGKCALRQTLGAL